jgi:hypothetical protein
MGTGSDFSGVKSSGREDDHSPSTAEVKNGGAILLLPMRLHGIVLNKLGTSTNLSVRPTSRNTLKHFKESRRQNFFSELLVYLTFNILQAFLENVNDPLKTMHFARTA